MQVTSGNRLRAKAGVIFECKYLRPGGSKDAFRTTIDGVKYAYSCKDNRLIVADVTRPGRVLVEKNWSEQDICNIIEKKKERPADYAIIEALFKAVTKSSIASPLIAGCVKKNFNSGYPGHKIKLCLKDSRCPIPNPFTSGTEAEHFLIGTVTEDDCSSMEYLGEDKITSAK